MSKGDVVYDIFVNMGSLKYLFRVINEIIHLLPMKLRFV